MTVLAFLFPTPAAPLDVVGCGRVWVVGSGLSHLLFVVVCTAPWGGRVCVLPPRRYVRGPVKQSWEKRGAREGTRVDGSEEKGKETVLGKKTNKV